MTRGVSFYALSTLGILYRLQDDYSTANGAGRSGEQISLWTRQLQMLPYSLSFIRRLNMGLRQVNRNTSNPGTVPIPEGKIQGLDIIK